MGFKLFVNEELATESYDNTPVDLLNTLLSTEEYEMGELSKSIKEKISAITLAQEAIDSLDILIDMDKQALAKESISDEYLLLSNESFTRTLVQLGYPVDTLKISSEDNTSLSNIEKLVLSIEEKEEKKKSIMEKIKSTFKSIGESFANFGKLMGVAVRNDQNVIKSLREKIKTSGDAKEGELSNATKATVTRLTSRIMPYIDLKTISDGDIVKYAYEMSAIVFQDSAIDIANDNIKALIAGDYDTDKVKFKQFKPANKIQDLVYKSTVSNLEVAEKDIALMYFTNALPFGAACNYLYRTGKKPGIFTAATKIGYVKIKLPTYNHKEASVSLFKLTTLESLLKMAEKDLDKTENSLAKLIAFYNSGEAIGDVSPVIFAQHMWENIDANGTFYKKGLLHMVNVMLDNYKR